MVKKVEKPGFKQMVNATWLNYNTGTVGKLRQ